MFQLNPSLAVAPESPATKFVDVPSHPRPMVKKRCTSSHRFFSSASTRPIHTSSRSHVMVNSAAKAVRERSRAKDRLQRRPDWVYLVLVHPPPLQSCITNHPARRRRMPTAIRTAPAFPLDVNESNMFTPQRTKERGWCNMRATSHLRANWFSHH